MPEDSAGSFAAGRVGCLDLKIRDAVRVEMYFTMVSSCQSLEQFGESTFGAVTAIHKGRNYGEAQISEPNGGLAASPDWRQVEC